LLLLRLGNSQKGSQLTSFCAPEKVRSHAKAIWLIFSVYELERNYNIKKKVMKKKIKRINS